MRPLLFVVCFTLGVTLMVFSGYVPRAASAHQARLTTDPATESASKRPDTLRWSVARPDRPRPARSPTAGADAIYDAGPDVTYEEPTTNETAPPLPDPDDISPESVPDASNPPPGSTFDPPPPAELAAPQPTPTDIGPDAPSPAPGDAGPEPPPTPQLGPPPAANAGPDRIVWAGWDELVLDGTASTGDGLLYTWTQISGPQRLTISGPAEPLATATGLPTGARLDWAPALYRFALTVVDEYTRQATDEVEFVVLSAPDLTLTPPAQRRFELRDGYWLGHFQSWITNLETTDSTFRIESPTRLTFTRIMGGRYRVASARAGDAYAYDVTVTQESGEPASFVELLVDTDEKTPGVVQLGVMWVDR